MYIPYNSRKGNQGQIEEHLYMKYSYVLKQYEDVHESPKEWTEAYVEALLI